MPQLTGFDVQARLTEARIRLPVIIITRCDRDANRVRALAAGASAYLSKPVDQQTLLDAIAAAISQPPAPASSAANPAVNRHHPESEEYDDRQPGNNG
jgi:FixJ family two-component response regulator